MDIKKSNAPLTTITRDISDIDANTGTIYEAIMIIAKRANAENLEEVFENKEQIEVSRFYEKLPKPTAIAIQEWMDDRIYFRHGSKKADNQEIARGEAPAEKK